MSRILVNIVTPDDPASAYLFIKEMYRPGDRLMFISAKQNESDIDYFAELLQIPGSQIDEIVLLANGDELAWDKMCRSIKFHLNNMDDYYVNLAGGSKIMSLAVQQVFEQFNASFFYLSHDNNLMVSSRLDDDYYNEDDRLIPLKYRMSISEYLKLQHLPYSSAEPIRSEEYARHLFTFFTDNLLPSHYFDLLETLRKHYRSQKKTNIALAEHPTNVNKATATGLSAFLKYIDFLPATAGHLSRDEMDYLTGGWFEEYVYYLIKRTIHPQDIALGVYISRNGMRHSNELDVVFTKGNKLFVVECKTGVHSESLFNEIVYKACALKEALLGIACHSYIFSLKKDTTGELKKTARYMDITFCDYHCLTSPPTLYQKLHEMTALAFD